MKWVKPAHYVSDEDYITKYDLSLLHRVQCFGQRKYGLFETGGIHMYGHILVI